MPTKTEELIARLRKRAGIRRSIPRGEPDRISDILEEAANEIESLLYQVDRYTRMSEIGESLGGELEEREARMAAETTLKALTGNKK